MKALPFWLRGNYICASTRISVFSRFFVYGHSVVNIVLILWPNIMHTQEQIDHDTLRKDHMTFEIGGAGILASAGFEYLNSWSSSHKFVSRIGASYMPILINDHPVFGIIGFVYGKYYLLGIAENRINHLELGVMTGYYYEFDAVLEGHQTHLVVTPSVGFRRQSFVRDSLYFSLAYSHIFSYNEDYGFRYFPWGKIGFGYSF